MINEKHQNAAYEIAQVLAKNDCNTKDFMEIFHSLILYTLDMDTGFIGTDRAEMVLEKSATNHKLTVVTAVTKARLEG
jgi:hypothetical protein